MTAPPVERLKAALADRYAVERELGRGGMATVYLAEDLKHRRKVAIKLLHPELAAILGPDRFLREIETAAQLQHPHVVPLYDSGGSDQFLYYVMPYVQGESLRQKLRREKQIPLEGAIILTRQVASALDYAHRRGLIHRDIKPENILLHEGEAVVADFGIALAVQAAGGERLTETGLSLGTPEYMSPEQASGDRDLDARTDVYALGCVLYEVLAGEPPYTGPSVQSIISKCLTDPVPHLRRVRSTVSESLDRAVRKALAKTPADRFGSAGEFAEALTASSGPKATSHVKTIAVLPFANLSPDPDNEYFSDGITEDIINALTKVPQLGVASRTSTFAFKRKELDIRQIGEQLNVDTVLEGSVRRAGTKLRITAQLITVADGYHLWSERYDRDMEDVFAVQDDIARSIVDALRIKLVGTAQPTLVKQHTDNLEAYNLYLKGRHFWNRRGESLLKAADYFAGSVKEDPRYAPAYCGLADSYSLLAWWEYAPPREAFPKALTAASRAVELDGELGEAHTSLAFIRLLYDWDWPAAQTEFARALELNPGNPTTPHWHALFLMATNRLEEAVAEAQRAQQLDPLGLIINVVIGTALYMGRRYEEAIREFRKVIEMDSGFAPTYIWLALSHIGQSRYDEAVDVLQEVVRHNVAGVTHRAVLGCALGLAGRTSESERVLDELHQLAKTEYVSPFGIAVVEMGLGRSDDAFLSLEQAYEHRSPWLVFLGVYPLLDPLRTDPRFSELVRKVGFEPGRSRKVNS
jgi:serine/threonine-protein kinase